MKKISLSKILKNIFLLFILFGLSSCKFQGTNTGNPSDPVGLTSTVSSSLSWHICQKQKQCFTPSDEKCSQQVFESTILGEALGLSDPYKNLLDAHYGEFNLSLVANVEKFKSCIQFLNSISCGELRVQKSLDPSLNYQYLDELLVQVQECENIF